MNEKLILKNIDYWLIKNLGFCVVERKSSLFSSSLIQETTF